MKMKVARVRKKVDINGKKEEETYTLKGLFKILMCLIIIFAIFYLIFIYTMYFIFYICTYGI